MEITHYIDLFRRWAWLVVFCLLLGGGIGYGVSLYQTPIYNASAKVMVMRAPEDSISSVSDETEYQLAQTYTQLLITNPVLEAVSERLDQDVSGGQITVQQVRGTSLIEIKVEDSDPQQAADIANTLVEVSIEQYEMIQASRFVTSEQSLQAQLTQVEGQIAELQSEIMKFSEEGLQDQLQFIDQKILEMQAEIDSIQVAVTELMASAYFGSDVQRTYPAKPTATIEQRVELALKSDRLDQLKYLLNLYQQAYVSLTLTGESRGFGDVDRLDQIQATLALYQQIYTNLLGNYEAVRLARMRTTHSVVLVEEAESRRKPIRPNPLLNIGVGSVAGIVFVVAVVFIREQLDETLKNATDFARVLRLPLLGFIIEEKHRWKRNESEAFFVIHEPQSPITEAFRTLKINIEFSMGKQPLRSLLVSSPGASEGKTTVAVNLAAVMAQAGKNVILLDADLRKPSVHRFLNVDNQTGLTDIICNREEFRNIMQRSPIDQLNVITSGELPTNPAEILSSNNMNNLLEKVETNADIVIIDSPPFHLAETSVLASMVDGVLLVVQPGHTKAGPARAMLDQLERANARVLGVVLNRIPRGKGPYGPYQYYTPEYYPRTYEFPSFTEMETGDLSILRSFDGPTADLSTGNRININTASITELVSLPGIGPNLANEIISYREYYGSFNNFEDLRKVNGLGSDKISRIADFIYFY